MIPARPPSHRRPAVAGTFYPGEAGVLQAQVDQLLAAAEADAARTGFAAAGPQPSLLVAPHAGYIYSGPVAAHAYALLGPLRSRIRRVVLLGPTHRVAVRGIAAPSSTAFDTPLGAVPVDRAAIDALADLPQVIHDDRPHLLEHALEVQLPFLQIVLERFGIVPLAVGDAEAAEVAQVIDRLWGGDETLVVVSTDLSHYRTYRDAQALDGATVARILRAEPVLDHEAACGATPLNGALLVARRRGLKARLLDLRNSGDTAGDRSRVVGYAAIAFTAPAGGAIGVADDEAAVPDEDTSLGPALIARARNTIAASLGQPVVAEPAHPRLARPGATFVTLRRQGLLRGCVGRIEAGAHTLDEDVRMHARAAAFHDTRFEPLGAAEWEGLEVEVSLLGAPQPLHARDEPDLLRQLHPHLDGVVIAWRHRRATFLPQVWEQLPDPTAFMAALKHKAGLPADFWHPAVEVSRYRVRKFGPRG